MKPTARIIALVLTSAVAVSPFGLSPALASVPAFALEDGLYAFDCDQAPHQLWKIDPTTGASTPVGTPDARGAQCPWSSMVDPADGLVHMFLFDGNDNVLSTVDLSTGQVTFGNVESGSSNGATSSFIDAASNLFTANSNTLLAVDSSGVVSDIGQMANINSESTGTFNPVDGTLYYISRATQGALYIVDPATASSSLAPVQPDYTNFPTARFDGMAIDKNGIAWLTQRNAGCSGPAFGPGGSSSACGIMSLNLATGELTQFGYTYDASGTVYPAANVSGQGWSASDNPTGYFRVKGLIYLSGATPTPTPTPELPNTGTSTVEIALSSISALLLLGFGVVAVKLRRRSMLHR